MNSFSKTSRRRASIQGIYNPDNENRRTSITNHTDSLHSINSEGGGEEGVDHEWVCVCV